MSIRKAAQRVGQFLQALVWPSITIHAERPSEQVADVGAKAASVLAVEGTASAPSTHRTGSGRVVPKPASALPPLPTKLAGRRVDGWKAPPPTDLVEAGASTWAEGRHFELAVLDASESMFQAADGPRRVDILLAEFGRYADRLRRWPDLRPRVAVVWFTGEAFLGCAWTDRLDGLHERLMCALPLPGATNFASALRATYAMLTARPFPEGAHVVVRLFSDGQHLDDDEPTPIALAVKRLGVQVHTIGCAAQESDVDDDLMREIATRDEENNPRYTFAGDFDGLRGVFDRFTDGLERPRS